MSEYPPAVYRVLEYAESYTPQAELESKLTEAITFCLYSGLVRLQRFEAQHRCHRPLSTHKGPPPASWVNSWPQLQLTDQGAAALALHRLTKKTADPQVTESSEQPAEDLPSEELSSVTVWHQGGKSYSLSKGRPIVVSTEEHNVLTAFLNNCRALDTKELQKFAANPSRVVAQLEKKFPGSVQKPSRKGEGYIIQVRPVLKP